MSKYQLLRMTTELLRRNLLLSFYTKDKIDAKRMPHSRTLVTCHYLQTNNLFEINNIRKELTFSYYSWYCMVKI
jgi:hypothetical protein